MKTNMLKLAATILLIGTLAACKKDNINSHKSRSELLTQKNWAFENYGLDENNNGVIEESESGLLSCQQDDKFTFYSNGTGTLNNGTQECSLGEPATVNFTWTFENNETELSILGSPETISRLDENVLEVYYMDETSQGQPVKYIRRFKH